MQHSFSLPCSWCDNASISVDGRDATITFTGKGHGDFQELMGDGIHFSDSVTLRTALCVPQHQIVRACELYVAAEDVPSTDGGHVSKSVRVNGTRSSPILPGPGVLLF